jgi:hypothetical protein
MKPSEVLRRAVILAEKLIAEDDLNLVYGCNCIKIVIGMQIGIITEYNPSKMLELEWENFHFVIHKTSLYKETLSIFELFQEVLENGDISCRNIWFRSNSHRLTALCMAFNVAKSMGR